MSQAVLTRRQSEILTAIVDFIEANGYQPTYQKLGEIVGIRSTGTMWKHISNLQRKGFLSRTANFHGDMKILHANGKFKCCPTCGHRKTA